MTTVPPGASSTNALRLLKIALRHSPPPDDTLPTLTLADVHWLVKQGVLNYLYLSLRNSSLLDQLPQETRDHLRLAYQQNVLQEAVRFHEATETILPALSSAGIESVLVKGMALVCTTYPDPRWRPKSDLDIWIQPEQLLAATAALNTVGYEAHELDDRPAALQKQVGGELKMVSQQAGTGLIELQWPAIRGEWVRHVTQVNNQEMWERRVPIVVEGHRTHVMTPEDTLIHLCLHLAINHQFGYPWLRALLDIDVLTQKHAIDWPVLIARVRTWRVATATWAVLNLTTAILGTPIPKPILDSLAPSPLRQRAIARLNLSRAVLEMRPSDYHHRRFVIQLLMVDHLQEIARLLGGALFPSTAWLQARYDTQTPAALWKARLLHPLRLLFRSKA